MERKASNNFSVIFSILRVYTNAVFRDFTNFSKTKDIVKTTTVVFFAKKKITKLPDDESFILYMTINKKYNRVRDHVFLYSILRKILSIYTKKV